MITQPTVCNVTVRWLVRRIRIDRLWVALYRFTQSDLSLCFGHCRSACGVVFHNFTSAYALGFESRVSVWVCFVVMAAASGTDGTAGLLCFTLRLCLAQGALQNKAQEVLAAMSDSSAATIADLQQKRRSISSQRTQVTREIKNETRKRKRLLSKVSGCTTEQLLTAAALKAAAEAKAIAKATASGNCDRNGSIIFSG